MGYASRVIPFPATHLSVFERVRSADTDIRRAAFGDIADVYWRPSYHYLRLKWQLSPDDAEDVVQAFFAVAFEKHYIDRFDPSKAKFRTFLRMCLDRFVQNQRQADRAEKRGGGAHSLSLDFPGAEHDLAAEPALRIDDVDRFFHDETIRTLFGRAVEQLRTDLARDGKSRTFDVFSRHDLHPDAETTYGSVATALGLTVAQVTNDLHDARRRFRDIALACLRAASGTDDEYRAEARELFGVEVRA